MQIIFEQSYRRTQNLVEREVPNARPPQPDLKELAEIAVPVEIRAGKEKLFVQPKLIRLLTQDSNECAFY